MDGVGKFWRYLTVSFIWGFATTLGAYAGTSVPSASPSPPASTSGPCATPAVTSIAVRPGIGRAPATSGSVCVAAPGEVVIDSGYRYQVTAGPGREYLTVYPEPVLLIGIARRTEVIVSPSMAYSRRSGVPSQGFPLVAGQQDAGVGIQHVLSDRPWIQQAMVLFATYPTGYPAGPSGFSIGTPTYLLSYAIAANVGNLGLSTSQGVLVSSGQNRAGFLQRYLSYQPTVNVSYPISTRATVLIEDQITAPTGPQAPTGNRALLGLQQTLSPNVVLDVEYEANLLPVPGFSQHSFGIGVTTRI